MQLNRRHIFQAIAQVGKNKVFTFAPMGQGMELTQMNLDTVIVGAENLLFDEMAMYSIRGYLIPIMDADTVDDPDDVWDRFVPKDGDFGSDMDFDTAVGDEDRDPFEQPGEVNVEELFGGYSPLKLFERNEIVHALSPGSVVVSSTQYKPMVRVKSSIRRNVRVHNPSVIMFAVSTPTWASNYDSYTTGENQEWLPANIVDWFALSEPDDFVKQWARNAMGIAEHSSTDTDAINQLFRFVEQIHVQTDGKVENTAFQISGKATYQVTTSAPAVPVLHG